MPLPNTQLRGLKSAHSNGLDGPSSSPVGISYRCHVRNFINYTWELVCVYIYHILETVMSKKLRGKQALQSNVCSKRSRLNNILIDILLYRYICSTSIQILRMILQCMCSNTQSHTYVFYSFRQSSVFFVMLWSDKDDGLNEGWMMLSKMSHH